jgi:hypothetical protein
MFDKSCLNYLELVDRCPLSWFHVHRPSKGRLIALRTVPDFRLLTNHGNALLLIACDPRIRVRDLATSVEITERAAQSVVADLISTGYLDREREGRRNVYQVRTNLPLRLPFARDLDIKSLLAIMGTPAAT